MRRALIIAMTVAALATVLQAQGRGGRGGRGNEDPGRGDGRETPNQAGVLTDNGVSFRSKRFAAACRKLGLKHIFTRPYRPQTNGKAERFIQSALREWAYGIPYHYSAERTAMLKRWTHHYNWHRPHHGIGGVAPMSRLNRTRNNLLTLHS